MYCTIYNNDNPYVEIYTPEHNLYFAALKAKDTRIKKYLDDTYYFACFGEKFISIQDYKIKRFSFASAISFAEGGRLISDDGEIVNSDSFNYVRLENNLRRIVRTTFDLCAMNKFDYFMTVTINGKKHNRTDLESLYSSLSKYFNNYKTRNSNNFKYLCLPELHSDRQNYHFHCLVSGVSNNDLIHFSVLEHIPKKIKIKLSNGEDVYKWQGIENSFGFNSLIKTYGSQEDIAKYMTKYITKSIYVQKNFPKLKLLRHSSKLVKPEKKYISLKFDPVNYKVYDAKHGFISRLPLDVFNSLQSGL